MKIFPTAIILITYLDLILGLEERDFPFYFNVLDDSAERVFFTICIVVLIGSLTEIFFQLINLNISEVLTVFCGGIGFSVIANYYEPFKDIRNEILICHPRVLLFMYATINYFKTFVFLESKALVKSMIQAILIVIFGTIMDTLMMFVFLYFTHVHYGDFEDPLWKIVLIYILASARGPDMLGPKMKEFGPQTEYIFGVLELESAITVMKCITTVYFIANPNRSTIDPHFILMEAAFKISTGFVLGYIVGKILTILMNILITTYTSILLLTLAIPMLAVHFNFGGYLVYTTSMLCTIGYNLYLHRLNYPIELDSSLKQFWKILGSVNTNILCFFLGMMVPTFHTEQASSYIYIYLKVCLLYVFIMLSRFITMMIVWPIFKYMRYHFTWKEMLIFAWCYIESLTPMMLILCMMCYGYMEKHCDEYFILFATTFILSYIINGVTHPYILLILREKKIDNFAQINFDNCMKYVLSIASYRIEIFKLRQNPGPINWGLIEKTLKLDQLPKKSLGLNGMQDIKNYIKKLPDDYIQVISDQDYRTKQANLRILTALKVSFETQYDDGFLPPNVLKTLLNIIHDTIYNSKTKVFPIDTVSSWYDKKFMINLFLSEFFHSQIKMEQKKRPRHLLGAICHTLKWNKFYILILDCACIAELILMHYIDLLDSRERWKSYALYILPWFIVTSAQEIVLDYFAFSRDGYWKSLVYCVKCITVTKMITLIAQIFLYICFSTKLEKSAYCTATKFLIYVLRYFRLLWIILQLYYHFLPGAKSKLEYRLNENLFFLYKLGRSCILAQKYVCESIYDLGIDYDLEAILVDRINRDRREINRRLGILIMKLPWVSVTKQTKDASRQILNNLKLDLEEIKMAGELDESEYKQLNLALEKQIKGVLTFERPIYPLTGEELFLALPWMQNINEDVKTYLLKNIHTKIWEPNSIIFEEGDSPEGIYVIALGALKVVYVPNLQHAKNLEDHGSLPIIEGLFFTSFNTAAQQYITSGNSFGEFALISKNPYNCQIYSETQVLSYLIPAHVFRYLFDEYRNPVKNLEGEIWKHATLKIARQTLMDNVDLYLDNEEIDKMLERAFFPNLKDYKVFVVHMGIQALVLIEGLALEPHTDTLFVAPCNIPRYIEKLALPRSGLLTQAAKVDTKMLIIPHEDVEEIELMAIEEEISDLWSRSSGRCLYQNIAESGNAETVKEDYKRVHFPSIYKADSSEFSGIPGKNESKKQKKVAYRDLRGYYKQLRNIDLPDSRKRSSK